MRDFSACPRQLRQESDIRRAHRSLWVRGNWSRTAQWADRLRDWWSRWRDRWDPDRQLLGRDRFYGGTYWPRGFDPPRTCSYCGGAHPDDAVALVLAGWEAEATGKAYKRYLHPPGYTAGLMRLRGGTLSSPGPYVATAIPSVKVYTFHFDRRQGDQFNAALEAQDAPCRPH